MNTEDVPFMASRKSIMTLELLSGVPCFDYSVVARRVEESAIVAPTSSIHAAVMSQGGVHAAAVVGLRYEPKLIAHLKWSEPGGVVGCSGGRDAGTQPAMLLALPEETRGMVLRLKEGGRRLGKGLPRAGRRRTGCVVVLHGLWMGTMCMWM